MTVQCVKGNDGRWWWVHRESMPSPLVAKELLPHGGSVSKLRSGEDWSWPREGGQGGEREIIPEICKDLDVMAHSGTSGGERVVFC